MKRKINNRKLKKRPGNYNYIMKFGTVIGIILIAIMLGYGSARYIIGPAIGYDMTSLKLNIPSHAKVEKEKKPTKEKQDKDKEKVGNTKDKEEYALQFGCFSTKKAANKLARVLSGLDVKTSVKLIDEQYKVIGKVYNSKQKAKEELENFEKKTKLNAFVTKI